MTQTAVLSARTRPRLPLARLLARLSRLLAATMVRLGLAFALLAAGGLLASLLAAG